MTLRDIQKKNVYLYGIYTVATFTASFQHHVLFTTIWKNDKNKQLCHYQFQVPKLTKITQDNVTFIFKIKQLFTIGRASFLGGAYF